MNIGMLWFDNDPKKELDVKIERAATYYREKYGKMPTVCFVHPSMVPETPSPAPKNAPPIEIKLDKGQLHIRTNQSVLPNHFWIGVNGTKTSSSDS